MTLAEGVRTEFEDEAQKYGILEMESSIDFDLDL
jgi:hypothetical protein